MRRQGLRILALAVALVVPAAVAFAQAAGFVATVTAESTDLRLKASEQSPALDTVLEGTRLPAFGLSPDKRWVRVQAPDGSTVWVSRADVKVAKAGAGEPPPPAATPKPAATAVTRITPPPRVTPTLARAGAGTRSLAGEKKLAHVVVEKTKLQLNATKSSPTLAIAKKNDQFEVGGFSRDQLWVKVRTEDGRIGYIQKADVRPGPAPSQVARATPTPRPRPGDGFDDPKSGFDGPPPDDDPPPMRRRRPSMQSDLTLWADGGLVLINETMTSNEGFGYKLNATGFGAGIRFEKRVGPIFLEGGYLGTANQRIPAPESSTTVTSTLHRIDVSAVYRYYLVDEDGPSVSALAGIQNYSFVVQPQNLSWFYSMIYNSGAVGLGGEYPFGDWRVGGDFRYFVPVLASERYGNGGAGGDGQSNTSTGYSAGLGVRRQFYSGASLGLGLRAHMYDTQFSGTGRRGPNEVTGVRVKDSFTAVTLTYARGF